MGVSTSAYTAHRKSIAKIRQIRELDLAVVARSTSVIESITHLKTCRNPRRQTTFCLIVRSSRIQSSKLTPGGTLNMYHELHTDRLKGPGGSPLPL